MALMPSHKLYPKTTTFIDSFHSSVVTKFRYGSSIPVKNQSFYSNIDNFNSNPQKRFNFLLKNKSKSLGFASNCINRNVNFSSVSSGCGKNSTWLDKWRETHKRNKLKKPQVVVNYKNYGDLSGSDGEDNNGSRTDVSGSTMDRIVEKLKKFGFNDDDDDVSERKEEGRRVIEKGSIEDIFYVEDGMLPNSRGGFSEKYPLGDDNMFGNGGEVRFPWEKPELVREEEKRGSVRERSRTCLAELTLPQSEMRRLTNLGLQIKNKTKIGGSGVTKEIVEKIHQKWKSSEVVRLKIEGPPALNMKRMHEILERKTGGLVIWRSGTSVTLYRGVSYESPSERSNKRIYKKDDIPHNSYPTTDDGNSNDTSEHNNELASQVESTNTGEESKGIEAPQEVKYEHEIDILLDGLGPRYTDWPGGDPLPIDADLLPGVVPGYQPPFRLLPYGVRSTLGMKEGTALRRLARVLPPHFALGRSRQHQGLAAAMVKLWERSSVAKIAVKRGVQLTTSERMAEDIKRLTGGILLSRNKDFIVFYRGKNFLSPEVAEVLLEKERLAKSLQDEEEQARLRASAFFSRSVETTNNFGSTASAGTLGETLDADARWGKKLNDDDRQKVMREAEITRHSDLVRKLEKKLAFAERKITRAERALSKVEESLTPADPSDPQSLTDEERFMFRKLGLRMKAFLLLGRRGIFDGTVENMHLHWKYRELVKIIVKAKNIEEVKTIALSLESESGGVLVSMDKVSKGYAVIVFRGKDYSRPSTLRPKNLLTKRKALARSIELQRRGALLHHISTLQTRVNQLRAEIGQVAAVEGRDDDEELYDKIDAAYSTEDEDSEEEGEDAYLETYETDDDDVDGNDSATDTVDAETNFPYAFQGQPEEVEQ